MSMRDKSLVATTALAVAVASSMLAGMASAADVAVKAPPPPPPAPFFLVNDTSVSFTWYANGTNPGVPGGGIPGNTNSFSKYVGSVTHFDVWAYGTNFFN